MFRPPGVGLLFRIKTGTCGTRAHGRALIPPSAGPPTRSMLNRVVTIADILGSFIIKRLLNITLFLLHKRPNIFNVLAITSA